MRLQNKILLLLVPMTVLPLLVLGWAAYSQLIDDTRSRTQREMTTLLEQIKGHTRTQLRTARANASLFASNELIQRYVRSGSSAQEKMELGSEVRKLLFNYQLAYPEYYEIRIVSPDGKEQVRSVLGDVRNLLTDESTSGYFREITRQHDIIYTTFYINPDNDKTALLTSKPLRFYTRKPAKANAEMELYGYLLLTVDLGFLSAQVERERIGETGRLFVTDDMGNVLFHPQDYRPGELVPPELFHVLREGVKTRVTVEAESRGQPAYFQGVELHDRLYVFAVYPEQELVAQSIILGRSVAIVTFFAILLTTTFLFGILKTLLIKPIQKLSIAAREMGRGQVLVPIDVKSADEIGDLAKTFTEMGENLDDYHEQVRYVAYHDSLTGLPNRAMFKDYLNRATSEARRKRQELAVLFLDLDNFKRINDTLGHHAGDHLLQEVADRLSHCMRDSDMVACAAQGDSSDVVARLAGDEFIILLPRIAGPVDAQKAAARILGTFEEPFAINQQELYVSASIGIALFPDDGMNTDDLLKSADIAMYHAKKQGRNNYQYFSRKLNEEAVLKLKIEGRLRRAMEYDELELHYQPQMDLSTGRITGVEALLRWTDTEMGPVSPAVFVPVAEEYGLIVPLSEWVIHAACRQARQWQRSYHEQISMSINVSGIHFNGQGLERVIARTIAETGLSPQSIELELTETAILQDPDLAIRTLEKFKEMGLQISLDDFGTGYSSLSYVMKLPLDKLKVDQCFIRNLEQGTNGTAIVSAIIAMAHSLGLSVIAEGVEEESHMQLLRQMRCDTVQGYHIARPMPAYRFEEMLRNGSKRRA